MGTRIFGFDVVATCLDGVGSAGSGPALAFGPALYPQWLAVWTGKTGF